MVVDAHGVLTDGSARVAPVQPVHARGVDQPRRGAERREHDQREPGCPVDGPDPLALRDEQHDRRLQGQQCRVPQQLPLEAGDRGDQQGGESHAQDGGGDGGSPRPDGEGEERAAHEHRHEGDPARLQHDRPVGVPVDEQVDQPETGEHQPGQGAEHREDTSGEHAHEERMPQAGASSGGGLTGSTATGTSGEAGMANASSPAVATSSATHAALPPT